MRITLSLLGVALALFALVSVGAAAPSFFGYTGLVMIPTADSLDKGEYNLEGFAMNVDEGDDITVFGANYGAIPNLELGFARIKPDDSASETWLNAKYTFMPETETNPAVAGGVIDLTDETETTAYIVMSKAFGRGYKTSLGEITSPRFHAGVGGGRLDGIFGGVSATLADRFTLMAEYDSENFNWGARLAITPELRVHFGAFDVMDDAGLGLSYNKQM